MCRYVDGNVFKLKVKSYCKEIIDQGLRYLFELALISQLCSQGSDSFLIHSLDLNQEKLHFCTRGNQQPLFPGISSLI